MDGTELGIVHSPHPAQSTGHQAFRRLLGCTLFRWEYPQSIAMVKLQREARQAGRRLWR